MGYTFTEPPKFKGVTVDFGDSYYNPATGVRGMLTNTDFISSEERERIEEQTGSQQNSEYILRPYSQAAWKPSTDSGN
jgi:hypothetical protein